VSTLPSPPEKPRIASLFGAATLRRLVGGAHTVRIVGNSEVIGDRILESLSVCP
jgi:hypothetical protein